MGQYQHDMPQARLSETWTVVEDCVNAVGWTPTPPPLPAPAGVRPHRRQLSKPGEYREENGAFTTRRQVLKVPKLGPSL